MKLAENVYKIKKIFPRDEQFGIVSQLRRAAVSVPSNIAEGFMRVHNKEYKQFLFIALGSCAELETQLMLCNRFKYLSDNKLAEFSENLDKINRMTMSLIKKL